ncbi:molybdopterin-dependent oxidoreductase [Pseudonocardia acaciae]|uniref:molybdopterin-dependent oxidoreductase n=1 Tax=Pseudonocardia acaciae TaxID=551276 RepID=UPI00048ADD33|nr:molybdopterin-dependent oxidoreductase [Pseudonocardia acaciae]
MGQRRVTGYCTLCKSHCGSVSVLDGDRLVAVEPLPGHPTGGALCAKGRAMPELTHSPRRLTTPMRRTNPKDADDPGWVPIGWDEALDEIAARLVAIRAESGPEAVAFSVTTSSGTPMVDGTDLVNHFVRHFGSPNIVYATEICGWHKNFAHAFTYGKGIGTPDYRAAELIILWGHNPARTWLTSATAVAEARRDGAKVVVVDPKRGGSGQQADLWVRIRPGTDGALALGAIHHMISSGRYDEEFVRAWTNAPLLVDTATGELARAGEHYLVWASEPRPYDTRRPLARPHDVALRGEFTLADGRTVRPVFDLLAEHVAEWTPERVAETTWIDPAELADFYALLTKHRRVSYYSWTGVGQHTNATQTERALGVLYALLGSYDQPGGLRWVNKQPANPLGAFSILPRAEREKALGFREMPLGPPVQGHVTARDFRRAVLDGEPYRVRAMVGFGANMVVSQGASDENRKALRALEFQVQCDMFENPTANTADILLPVCAPPERPGLMIGFDVGAEGEELVQLRERMIPPAGDSRSDYDIVFALAQRLGMSEAFFGGDLEAAWNHQLAPLGLTVADLRANPGGIRVPIAQRDRKYAAEGADGTVAGFATGTRRVELYSELMREHGQPALPTFTLPDPVTPDNAEFPYVMTTAKNGHYTHSSLRSLASLRRRSPDPSVEVSPALAAARGLAEGDWATVRTPDGQATLRVRLNDELHDRVVIAEHGWWDDSPPPATPGMTALGRRTSNINAALSDRRRDPISGSVPLRGVACDVRRDDETSAGNWAGWRTFRVASREPVETGALALTLRPEDGGPLPRFRPGQHVQVRSPEIETQRAYSLTNDGATAGALRIAVKDIGGRMSGHLHGTVDGRVADTVEVKAPTGTFTPPVGGARTVLCIGGGIGVTPFLGYLETLAAGLPAPPRVRLVYTRRATDEPAPIATRLAELAGKIPGVELHEHLTGGAEGRFSASDLPEGFLASRPLVYLCGPAAMMTELTDQLVGLGIDRFDVFTEEFFSDIEIPETLHPATVRFARTGRELTWTPKAGTLLDAADAAGVPLGSGCRTGVCESCVVRVRAGEVAHLSTVENEPGSCLTCQAIPLTDLVLEA